MSTAAVDSVPAEAAQIKQEQPAAAAASSSSSAAPAEAKRDSAAASGPTEAEFSRIILQTKGQKRTGQLTLTNAGLRWEEIRQNGKVVDIAADDMTELCWSSAAQAGKEHQLTVRMEGAGESSVKFQGFRAAALAPVKKWAGARAITFREVERATNGWNWGEVEFDDSNLVFKVGGKLGFELPLSTISQSVIQGKNEISIELHQDDLQDDEQALVEMRMWVPPDEKDPDNQDPLKDFNDTIIQKADIGVSREHYAEFEKLMFLTPRGRYNIRLFNNFFTLQGQTFQYKILYKNITKMFLFEMPDHQHSEFIISLNPPIRQGRTSYPFLIMNFKTADEVSMELNVPEKVIEEKYGGKITKVMEGNLYDVVSVLFKTFTGKKILIPGSFRSERTQSSAIRCSYKANLGDLFVLEKSFFFVHKPPLYIRHDEIFSIEFASHGIGDKNSGAGRNFDLKLVLRDSQEEVAFTSIDSGEFGALFSFIDGKELNILNAKDAKRRLGSVTTGSGRASRPIEGTFLAQMGEGDESEMDEDDSDEGDSDFEASSDDDESGASSGSELESEVDEEGMAAPKKKSKSSSSSSSSAGPKKEKAPKKEKPAVKRALSAYTYFTKAVRPQVSAENPDKSFGEIGSLLGQRWKELSAEDKAPYEELARQDKVRYQEEVDALPEDQRPGAGRKASSGEKKASGKKKASAKEPGQPKRPQGAYFLFQGSRRQAIKDANPGIKPAEIAKLLGAEWKEMSDEQKEPFNQEARAAKDKYDEAMLQWKRERSAAEGDAEGSQMEDDDDEEDEDSGKKSKKDKKKDKKKHKKHKKEKKSKKSKKSRKSKKSSAGSEDEGEDGDEGDLSLEDELEALGASGDELDASNIISGSRRKRTASAAAVSAAMDDGEDDEDDEDDESDDGQGSSKRHKYD